MTDRRQTPNRPRQPDLLAGVVSPAIPPTPPGPPPEDNEFWIDTLRAALAERSGKSKAIAEQALKACPTDPELMLLSALTALASGESGQALALLKRFGKHYQTRAPAHLLTALALADQRQYAAAWAILKAKHIDTPHAAIAAFIGDAVMHDWLRARLRTIKTLGSQPIRPVTQKRPEPPPPAPKKPPPRIKPPPPAAPASPRPAATRSPLRHDVRHRQSRRHRNRRRRPRPDPVPPARRTRPPLACSRNSTNCSACPRCTTSSRIGTRPKPSAKSSSNIAAASCWPTRSVSARPSRPGWC